jgi:mRNA interferase RelE/StbE
MTYNFQFKPKALKEWSKLGSTIKEQFKNKLKERLENPRVEKDKLSGYEKIYHNPSRKPRCLHTGMN